jgi:hypothetical protein
MSIFKVGDKVRILDNHGSDLKVGSEHFIEEACFDMFRICDFYFHDEHLMLIESKPQFKVGHSAICIKKTHKHNVGDVLLVTDMKLLGSLIFDGDANYHDPNNFAPCLNLPLPHYKERIADALGGDL